MWAFVREWLVVMAASLGLASAFSLGVLFGWMLLRAVGAWSLLAVVFFAATALLAAARWYVEGGGR